MVSQFLADLPHTGDEGFEGLVGRILEAEIGQRFRRVWSGAQRGRDLAACGYAIEAKHYFASLPPQRDLIAELHQAMTLLPRPDTWILASTAALNPDNLLELKEVGAEKGVSVVALDGRDLDIPRLLCLMAAQAVHTLAFARGVSTLNMDVLAQELAEVRARPAFDQAYRQIRAELGGVLLGHGDASRRSRERVLESLSHPGNAWSEFKQQLSVRAPTTSVVRRQRLHSALSNWLASDANTGTHAVVLGEEGMGKSWAVFDWVASCLEAAIAPIVLPLSSSARILQGQALEDLLPGLFERWTGVPGESQWRRRLERWLDGGLNRSFPIILLVVDGLNERADVRWPDFFSTLGAERWIGVVAVLATDRPVHWQDTCVALDGHGFRMRPHVGTYDDAELAAALGDAGFRYEDLPSEIQPLLRTPRYCRLVSHHFEEMRSSGDLTKARLLYLEARERAKEKARYPLSPRDFDEVIRSAALRHRGIANAFRLRDIAGLLPFRQDDRDIVGELTSSGVFVETRPGRFVVEPSRLAYALGFLLAEHVQEIALKSASAIEMGHSISEWFEPERNADLKVEAAAAALFHAALDPAFPLEGRRQLLLYWLGLRNWNQEAETAFSGYVLRMPEDFIAAADFFWSGAGDNGAAQAFLARAFVAHRAAPEVQPHLVRAVARWFGLVPGGGLPVLREGGGGPSRAEIADRVGPALGDGRHELAGHALTVTEDDALLGLRQLALLIVSAGPRLPFALSLVTRTIACAVVGMDAEFEQAAWVLRLATDDFEDALIAECERLLATRNRTCCTAARSLLDQLGSKRSLRLLARDPEPRSALILRRLEEHERDPCSGLFPLAESECLRCMAQTEANLQSLINRCRTALLPSSSVIPASLVERCAAAVDALDPASFGNALGYTQEEHALEKLELVLAGRLPAPLAAFWRRLTAELPTRELEKLRSVSGRMPAFAAAMSLDELTPLLKAAGRLDIAASEPDRPADAGERHNQCHAAAAKLTLAALPLASPDERWSLVLNRPEDGFDIMTLEHWFEPVSVRVAREVEAIIADPTASRTRALRAVWFASATRIQLSLAARSGLLRLAQSSDPGLCGTALRYVVLAGDDSLAAEILELDQSYQEDTEALPSVWGTELIATRAPHLTIEGVVARTHPCAWTFVAEQETRSERDLLFVADAFDAAWEGVIAGTESGPAGLPELLAPPTAGHGLGWPRVRISPRQEQTALKDATWLSSPDEQNPPSESPSGEERARRFLEQYSALAQAWSTEAFDWFGRLFSAEGISRILNVRPELGAKWASAAVENGPRGRATRLRLATFHSALVTALLDRDPVEGARLWAFLAGEAGSTVPNDILAEAPFIADSEAAQHARIQVLDACRSDAELSHVALLAVLRGRQAWLLERIRLWVRSPLLWTKAKGLALAAFSVSDRDSFESLVEAADIEGTWVTEQLRDFREAFDADRYARDWFGRFLAEPDDVASWGAYRMFLACADERALVWTQRDGPESDGSAQRRAFVLATWNDLERAAEERNRLRKERLFGLRTVPGDVLPFASL